MVCSNHIFNPNGLELRGLRGEMQFSEPTPEAEKIARSKARANAKIRDLILCNQFDYFVTLTLSPDKVNRADYSAVIKRLNNYLGNRVKRNGLYYVGVPELHKKGGFHFHFLMNDCLALEDSGTVIRPSGGRPVRAETARKQGFKLGDCRTVYNLKDWKIGFTTAIALYGDRRAIAAYVGKYITKGEKVGGRWYYSGGDLRRPEYYYFNTDFDSFEPDYMFETPNGEMLVRTYL